MARADTYQSVTDRIISALEEGTVPWRKPWQSRGGPVNVRTGRRYRGVNILLLTIQGFADNRWGTYKAIREAGGHVRKGEKGTHVILWKPVKKHGEDPEQDESYLLLRDYTVFNAEQADGLPPLEEPDREFSPIEEADRIVKGYVWAEGEGADELHPILGDLRPGVSGPPVFYGYDEALYSISGDRVNMPSPQAFESDEAFYSTLFHELVHSTGHEKRLNRLEPALFGSDPYAREELVAEIGASFLSGLAGLEIAGGDQSAAYIAGWLKALANDRKLVIQAAAQAQKAVDMIAGSEDVQNQGTSEMALSATS